MPCRPPRRRPAPQSLSGPLSSRCFSFCFSSPEEGCASSRSPPAAPHEAGAQEPPRLLSTVYRNLDLRRVSLAIKRLAYPPAGRCRVDEACGRTVGKKEKAGGRSEEGRVGKGCVCPCSCQGGREP